jgi:beta-glucosidase
MLKKIIAFLFISIAAYCAFGATISSVKVDGIRGYRKVIVSGGVDTNFYMGRVSYIYRSEGKDSASVDLAITKQGTTESALVLEKSGDIGLIRQINAADTFKTAYFRVRILGDAAGNYVANINGQAAMSEMHKLADSCVKLMTNDQKLTLLYSWTTAADQIYFGSDDFTLGNGKNMVGWRCADGPNGIRFPVTGKSNDYAIFGSGKPATVFATEVARGCTWDTTMARRVGQAIAQEALAMGLYCNLGPMSDLVVNPRWGRAFETMGEDPYLVGKMASSQVKGIQSERVISSPKHFVPYIKETYRADGQRLTLSERALRELFCVPFEMDIKEGGARAIMTCYNKVRVPGFTTDDADLLGANCERAGSNRHLINDILRNDWGFDGIIMTDWKGAENVDETYAFNTPFDMSMPAGDGFLKAPANITAKRTGWVVDTLDKKAFNVTYDKLWAWNGKLIQQDAEIQKYPATTIHSAEHLNLTLEEARESIVLVKNDSIIGAAVLPLAKTGTYKIALIGQYGYISRPGGGGSSAVTPDIDPLVSPIQGITSFLGAASSIKLLTDNANQNSADIATGADAAIVFVGIPKEEEGMDRTTMKLPDLPDVAAVMAKVKKTIVVYTGGSASVAGSWSEAPGILIAFYPGRNQAQAIAEALFGDINPSGHLSVTFPKTETDLPSYELVDFQMSYPSADTAHGYFYYEKTNKTPLFWFGHGLSYSSFEYTKIAIRGASTVSATTGERFDVIVSVKNTGVRAGTDVVQLYVKPKDSPVARRVKDLRAFCRISPPPGETYNATFTLGPRDFSIYDVNTTAKTGQWKVIPGSYDLIAGSTSNPAELVNGNGKCVIATVTVQ